MEPARRRDVRRNIRSPGSRLLLAPGLGIALLDDLPEPARTPLFTAGAWGIGTGLPVTLGLAEPPTEWARDQLATDIGHHIVYGVATASAYGLTKRLFADG